MENGAEKREEWEYLMQEPLPGEVPAEPTPAEMRRLAAEFKAEMASFNADT